jgi:hypothetical protein
MVPQRDRAFSWDVSFENTMHTDLAGNPIPAVADLNHLVNIPNSSSQGSAPQQPHQHPMNPPDMKDSSKLFIKAQFPKSKKAESVLESLPSIKMEVGKMEGFPSSSQADKLDSIPIDHFDLGSEDEDHEDGYYEDPLLLSIPPELLMGEQQATNNNNNSNNNASGNNHNSNNNNNNNGSGNGSKRRSRNGKHHHNNESKKSSPGTPSSNLAGLSMNNNNSNSSGSNNNKSGSGLTFTIGKFSLLFLLIFEAFNGILIIFRWR